MKHQTVVRSRQYLLLLVAILLVSSLTGCNKRTEPAAAAGFVADPEKMVDTDDDFPFQRVWVAEEYRDPQGWETDRVYIREVDTDFLMESEAWKFRARSDEGIQEDAGELAEYLREAFENALRSSKIERFEVVHKDAVNENTVVIEMAIVELVPTAATRNIAGQAASFVVPGGGLIGTGGRGSIAIEGRLRFGFNGKVIARFADRREDKTALVDIGGLTWYSRTKDTINDWASEFAELMTAPEDHEVRRASRFTLRPW